MALERKQKRSIVVGVLIGAILGAGAAYLLTVAPSDDQVKDEESKPITAMDLLALTRGVAALIRRLDDLRRRI